jgi:hypothetical protein
MRMSKSGFLGPVAMLAVLVLPVAIAAQAGGQKPKPPAPPPPMPAPKPGPEQAVFKMDVGTWDAAFEMTADGKPVTSKATEVNTLGCGGLCLISDFKGQIMGGPFHGHGVTVWDASKKKYVGSWTDSMATGLGLAEATWDPAAKKFTGTMDMPDQTGKVVKSRSVTEYPSADKRVLTMYGPGPDGKEAQMFKITYTRRKT